MTAVPPLLEVSDLAVAFPRPGGSFQRVVDGVSFDLAPAEVLGVVGESGCGKTLSALALLRLVPEPGRIVAGRVIVTGHDILTSDERFMCTVRGRIIGFLSQETGLALNPLRTIGYQVGEAARLHLGLDRAAARSLAVRLLDEVDLDRPEAIERAYPHQLSGGQRQRALLAAALAADPQVLIADEPTSALDTVSQARLLAVLELLRERRRLAIVFITHDLGVVERVAHRVAVLYAGETVEVAERGALFAEPLHPYTKALLGALPSRGVRGAPLPTIPGIVPRPESWGRSCRFAPRCPLSMDRCRGARPALVRGADGRAVRCFLQAPDEEQGG